MEAAACAELVFVLADCLIVLDAAAAAAPLVDAPEADWLGFPVFLLLVRLVSNDKL